MLVGPCQTSHSELVYYHTDVFIQLDEGYGVLVLDGVEAKLKEAKAGDMVTKEKLKVCQLMCGYSRSTVTLKVCLCVTS